MRDSKSERIIYTKVDIKDDASASHGDKVIELVFDTTSFDEKLNEIVMEQVIVTTIYTLVGGIVSLLLHKVLKV